MGKPPASAGAATKGCRSSGHRRQRSLARVSGDPGQIFYFITSESLSSEVEVVEGSTMPCNLAVSYFSGPHNVVFRIGGWKR